MQPFHLPPLTGRRERIPVTTHVWALVGIALFFGSAAPSAQKSTGKLTSDDLVEIQQLYARYNWTLDSGDAEGYASTFIPEGVFNNNVGHDAIVKFADTFHAAMGAHVKHWNTNLMITPTAEGAHGQVYLVLVDFANKPATIANAAFVPRLIESLPQRTSNVWCIPPR